MYVYVKDVQISETLFPLKPKAETVQYWEASEDFDTDYDRENPVTRKEAMAEWNRRDDP